MNKNKTMEKKKPGRKPYNDRGEISVPVTFWTKAKYVQNCGGIAEAIKLSKRLFEGSYAATEGGSE